MSALLAVLALVGVARAAAADEAIPKALSDWQGWAMKGQEFLRCPFLGGADSAPDAGSYRCVWPERLQLAVDAHGGRFTQRWQVYTEGWVPLPGDLGHWPEAVEVDGRPAPVVAHEEVPSLRLAPGTHTVAGGWHWEVRPETLAVPHDTALLDLSVDGVRIGQPERPEGQVALGRQESVVEPRSLDLQVYRLLGYGGPITLTTRLRIRAAGDAREESLGVVLPEGFAPLSLQSPVPARLERDGALHVQVRPGDFELTLTARQAGTPLYRMPQAGSLVQAEVWSFSATDRLAVMAVEGVPTVDPAQAQVPAEWRRYPAFELTPAARLRLVEHSRGMSEADQNRMRLTREMWLDFDHQAWTVRDRITGTLRRDWRLDLRAPYQLASAHSDGDLLVTRNDRADARGVELRSPQLGLVAVAQVAHPFGELPATGWTQGFESVEGRLHLPPGHRLIAVMGADESPTAWLNRWGLWNLFGVLVVIVFARWLAGWKAALIGGAALLLMCQNTPGLILGWVNLIAAIALARAASAGRLAGLAQTYRTVSLALVVLILLPFAVTEARDAIFPQLGRGTGAVDDIANSPVTAVAGMARPAAAPVTADVAPGSMEAALPAPPPPPPPAGEEENRSDTPMLQAQRPRYAPRVMREKTAPSSLQSQTNPPSYQYAPGANVQAGPGVPSWSYGTHRFGWSGPVDPGQTVRFIVAGPLVVGAWRLAGVALLALFLAQLLRVRAGPWSLWPGARLAAAPALLLLAVAPVIGHTQSLPDPKLLEELRSRLSEPPRCSPSCAELLGAQVAVSGARITVDLRASALARVAVALPSGADRWQIDTVTVDGVASLTVRREEEGGLWVPLEAGVHAVHVEAHLSGDAVHLVFPMPPRQISVAARGWVAAGLSAGRLLSGALDLTREQPAQDSTLGSGAQAQEFPPFVRVVREFQLGLDWSIDTRVERVSPSAAAFTVVLPLIKGESVLTEGLKVNPEGTVLVGLAEGEDSHMWRSSLNRGETLSVHPPALPARSEVWRFVVSPQWHADFRGLPATLPEDTDATPWVFEYHPRAGEGLDVAVTQPAAVAGATLAIDHAQHTISVGRRSADETLTLSYRSTQGGRQTLSLPPDASVTGVAVDGVVSPIRPQRGELALSVLPGEHNVAISWRSPRGGEGLAGSPDAVDLHAPASNVRTVLSLPGDRWPLFATGPGVGPAFLYWGELAIFLVVAFCLARSKYSPLSVIEWLLLGLGLSTLAWDVLLLVAVWLLAMSWREQTALPLSRSRFNVLQALLALLTVVAVSSLVFSGIRYGLLASPDMGVSGPGSGEGTFTWFMDHTSSALPRPVVYSVPMWAYRAVMFAWALWIALALARWLRFAWRAWNTGGAWRMPGSDSDTPRAAA